MQHHQLASGKGLLTGRHVLLGEDRPDSHREILANLQMAGAEVTLECHARSAASIALAEPDRFDVVIADISFDLIDWFQATQRLRCGGFERPIIALIYSRHEKSEQELLCAGITAVFTKPADAL